MDMPPLTASRAIHQAKPWVIRLARLGYAAKGIVYLMIGLIALKAAAGLGGKMTDTRGALEAILKEPFGQFLLCLVAIGLVGYALWRFIGAFFDPEHEGKDAKGILTRIGYAISGLVYAGLTWTAVQLIRGSAGHGLAAKDDKTTGHWTAHFLSLPFGHALVIAAGVIVIGVGLYGLYVAYKASFRKAMQMTGLSADQQHWLVSMGRFGFAVRGLVFGVLGVLLIQAALASDPSRARGLEGAQGAIVHNSPGIWLPCLIAFGFICFGAFMFVEARYHNISVS